MHRHIITMTATLVLLTGVKTLAYDCGALVYDFKHSVKIQIGHKESELWASAKIPYKYLPLQEGTNASFNPNLTGPDEATMSYQNGVLYYFANLRSSSIKEYLEIEINPDLDSIGRVKFKRTGNWFNRWFSDVGTFECSSVKIVN